ncbi:GNAT family N-acetyltransferase [Cellulomonas sp. P22]|uniref:GNAT family N-acetyltransferase n=1 Tax=Cellulomonas sp. P22 TaxID=3373189 RepID=UPI0037B48AD3
MTVSIRTARPADAPALARLAAITFPLACPPGSTHESQQAFIRDVLSAERFAAYLSDPSRVVLVAHETDDGTDPGADPGEPVGYTMLVDGEPTDDDVRAAITLRPTIELSKCYVLPGHHGRGIAPALMAASLDVGRARGARGVWLGVNQENARAQAFYARHGFARVGTKHFLVGTRLEDDFVLERAL